MKTRTLRRMLASGTRTATATTQQEQEYAAIGGRAYLNVTAASGTGGLTLVWRGYDKLGNAARILVGPVPVTGAGMYVYELLNGPASVNEGDVVHSISRGLPVQWDIQVQHGDSSNYTYSLSVETFY